MTPEEAADLIKWKGRAEKAEAARIEAEEGEQVALRARDALAAALKEAVEKYDEGSWRHEDIFKLARALDQHAPGWEVPGR